LGWRRVPFMYRGTMVQFGGLALMPFALLVLSGGGDARDLPAWIGQAAAGASFLLVGMGLHTTQTVGLALATDLSRPADQPKVVGLMYVMLLLGTIVSALLFGALLTDFTPGRLVQVIQGAAVAILVLNGVALWKQEPLGRHQRPVAKPSTTVPSAAPLHAAATTALAASAVPQTVAMAARGPSFAQAWQQFTRQPWALRSLLCVALGTLAFSMEEVLLEPYGGEVLHQSVAQTTWLTATLALGSLLGFGLASRVLSRGGDPFRMSAWGALAGIPAFVLIVLSGQWQSVGLFGAAVGLVGLGVGLFSHGTLTASMRLARHDQTGLALGAWGAAQASAAGLGVALGGLIRDLMPTAAPQSLTWLAAPAYDSVYLLEVLLLILTLVALKPLLARRPTAPPETP
jgi:MFS transporter, BCD family, chlorophyll transporter